MSIRWDNDDAHVGGVLTEINNMLDLFEETPCMLQAADVISSELLSDNLVWKKVADGKDAKSFDGTASSAGKKPGVGYYTFVENAVRSIMVSGCFFYRNEGSAGPRVAHPNETWLKDGSSVNSETVSSLPRKYPWTAAVCFPPKPSHCSRFTLDSPVRRAESFARQLNIHRKMHLKRDMTNSTPSSWLSISDRIQNTGHSKPWFRSVGTDYIDTFSNQLSRPTEYKKLVEDRKKVIESLGSSTVQMRQGMSGQTAEEDVDFEPDSQNRMHKEYIVTDGFQASEMRQLQSLGDSHTVYDKLECSILQILGVPPSALGRNQNSERMASANQLVARSMKPFYVVVEKYKNLIEKALMDVSENEHGIGVGFGKSLSPFDLERLEGIMTKDAVCKSYSSAYNVPLDWIDKDAVARRQAALSSVVEGKKTKPTLEDEAVQNERAHKKRKQETAPPTGAKDSVS